jgi:5-(carboxyamino)imidazole ribonucleotide mutase
MVKPSVGIIMGSDSDLPIMQEAATVLEELGVAFELTIVSAHRTPDRLYEYAAGAAKRGLKVIIAGAGGSAHLPGMTAAMTVLPVIGVPVQTKTLSGVDSLYSIVQMPPGIPVATVAINGAKNAGLLAAKIIATHDQKLSAKLTAYAKDLESSVLVKATKLESIGYKQYLKESV